jgi:phosphate transport system permease protein
LGWAFARAGAGLAPSAGGPARLHSLPAITAGTSRCGRRCRRCCSSASGRRLSRGWSSRRCWRARPASAARLRDAARRDPHRSARARRGQRQAAFNPQAQALAPVFEARAAAIRLIGGGFALLLAFAGGGFAFTRVSPAFRARTRVERLVMGLLLLASLIAILTTLGIVLSLLFESLRFFSMVSPVEFLFGTQLEPADRDPRRPGRLVGRVRLAIPLFWGTIFIGAIIAMIVAIPLGLMSAIYLTQYARRGCAVDEAAARDPRRRADRGLRLFRRADRRAGGPRLRPGDRHPSAQRKRARRGLVMGIMIIPFVSSMADDSIAAVPQAMRDGSLAMGATKSETIKKVLVPAALPGVVGGVLLAVSRAIGETMIVVMAAGLAANLTANPFESVTTVTTQIVQLLTGDQEFDSPKTLAAFALGLVLFLVTLLLNIIALRVVKKYREAYECAQRRARAPTDWKTGEPRRCSAHPRAMRPSAASGCSAWRGPAVGRLPRLPADHHARQRHARLHPDRGPARHRFPASDLFLDPAALKAGRAPTPRLPAPTSRRAVAGRAAQYGEAGAEIFSDAPGCGCASDQGRSLHPDAQATFWLPASSALDSRRQGRRRRAPRASATPQLEQRGAVRPASTGPS